LQFALELEAPNNTIELAHNVIPIDESRWAMTDDSRRCRIQMRDTVKSEKSSVCRGSVGKSPLIFIEGVPVFEKVREAKLESEVKLQPLLG
jgi:hypothetical protein